MCLVGIVCVLKTSIAREDAEKNCTVKQEKQSSHVVFIIRTLLNMPSFTISLFCIEDYPYLEGVVSMEKKNMSMKKKLFKKKHIKRVYSQAGLKLRIRPFFE